MKMYQIAKKLTTVRMNFYSDAFTHINIAIKYPGEDKFIEYHKAPNLKSEIKTYGKKYVPIAGLGNKPSELSLMDVKSYTTLDTETVTAKYTPKSVEGLIIQVPLVDKQALENTYKKEILKPYLLTTYGADTRSNCTTTTVKILEQIFSEELGNPEVFEYLEKYSIHPITLYKILKNEKVCNPESGKDKIKDGIMEEILSYIKNDLPRREFGIDKVLEDKDVNKIMNVKPDVVRGIYNELMYTVEKKWDAAEKLQEFLSAIKK